MLALLALALAPLPNGEAGKILPAQVTAGASFGQALAVDGGLAVVGAATDDALAQGSGSAHVVDLGTSQTLAKLVPSDGSSWDIFGSSVAIEGTTVLVGAPSHDDHASLAGAAYLFDALTGAQLFELLAADGQWADRFGRAVGLGGGRAVVGSPFDDDVGSNSGSVYLFDVASGQQVAKLHASDAGLDRYFGFSVAVEGSLALVGAPAAEWGAHPGAAYLIDLTTGQELRRLEPSDGIPGQGFGFSVALDGGLAVVGAPGDEDNGLDSGAAYVFDLASGQQLAKLRPIDNDPVDQVGASVAIAGNVVLVGAPGDDERGKDSGSAYLFDVGGAFLAKLIPSDGGEVAGAGTSACFTGQTALVGVPRAGDSGEVLLFDVAPEVPIGTSFCGPAAGNSSGAPGSIQGYGSLVVSENCVRLVAVDLPQDQSVLFLNSMQAGSSVPPGSQGTLCLGGSIGRYKKQVAHSGMDGAASVTLDLPFTPNGLGTVAILSGDTWYFQAWFRDDNPGRTSNLTDGIELLFQ